MKVAIGSDHGGFELKESVMKHLKETGVEVIQLSQAVGINLSQEDAEYYKKIIATLKPDGVPSMRQDGIAKRKTEVEMFAGIVRKLAKKHGIATPVNDLLYEKIKKIEEAY